MWKTTEGATKETYKEDFRTAKVAYTAALARLPFHAVPARLRASACAADAQAPPGTSMRRGGAGAGAGGERAGLRAGGGGDAGRRERERESLLVPATAAKEAQAPPQPVAAVTNRDAQRGEGGEGAWPEAALPRVLGKPPLTLLTHTHTKNIHQAPCLTRALRSAFPKASWWGNPPMILGSASQLRHGGRRHADAPSPCGGGRCACSPRPRCQCARAPGARDARAGVHRASAEAAPQSCLG